MLHSVVEGSGTAGRIVLVHGFTQTLASWDPIVAVLPAAYELVRVDLPGHGGSSAERATFDETAAAVAAIGGPDALYVGYSMGGRLCLAIGLRHASRGIVLVGASPGIADPGARAARAAADEELAAAIELEGTHAFLERWLTQPMFRTLQPATADLRARRANSATGLAAALRSLGPGVQPPLWRELPSLRAPALFVAGALDTRYVEIARRMAERAGPPAAARTLPDAGHAAHLERPTACAALIEELL